MFLRSYLPNISKDAQRNYGDGSHYPPDGGNQVAIIPQLLPGEAVLVGYFDTLSDILTLFKVADDLGDVLLR